MMSGGSNYDPNASLQALVQPTIDSTPDVVDSVALVDRRAAREAWKRHEEQAERAAACEELA